jgi:hypothetical protein
MKANAHMVAIDQKTLEGIETQLAALQALVSPYATPLTPHERHTLFKMGEKSLSFVEKCFEFAQKNPAICPSYLKMDDFETDFRDAHGLYAAVNIARQLLENLSDTQMAAGSEAFQSALIFYHSAKIAAENDVPGARAIFEELRKRFPSHHRRETPNTAPSPEA